MLTAIAFDQAYRTLHPRVLATMKRVTDNSADAEDMAQAAWLEAWRARATMHVEGLPGWLCKVASRLWWHRRKPVRVTGEDGVKRRVAGAEEVGIELAPEEAEDGGQEAAVEQGNLRREINRLHIVNPRYPDKPQAAPESMKETLRLALQHDTPADIARARAVAPSVAERALASGIAAIRKAWRLE